MLKLIIIKELREIIASMKFALTFLVCSLLIILSFYIGARNYQLYQRQYESAKIENLQKMENFTEWMLIEHHIFLPPQPLEFLVAGISNDIGRDIHIPSEGWLEAVDSRFNTDPVFAVFHFLDLNFIFRVILSLFMILFIYNSITREKELGTLRLSFANSVTRSTYILGKVVGAFLSLSVTLIIPILLGCLILYVMDVPMSANEWFRLGLIILAGYLFLGAFATLSLLVSTLTRRSSSSFHILLLIWIFSVLIIPRISVLLTGQAVDIISFNEMAYERITHEVQNQKEMTDKMKNARVTGTDKEALGNELFKILSELRDQSARKRKELYKRLHEQRRNGEIKQQRVALGMARISPAAVFSLAVTNIAGTSLELRQYFHEESQRYQEIYARFIHEKRANPEKMSRQEKPKPINPNELPEFLYQQPPVKGAIQSAIPDLGILVFFNVFFFACAFTAFLRYDVR